MLFYLGVITITASLTSAFMTYYYPVYVETGREEIPINVHIEIFNITYVPPPAPVFSTHTRYRTTYPLRDYAPLSYILSGLGLGSIIMHHLLSSKEAYT